MAPSTSMGLDMYTGDTHKPSPCSQFQCTYRTTFLRKIFKKNNLSKLPIKHHNVLKDRTSNHTPPPHFRHKPLKNYTHVYILCTSRFHIYGVPNFKEKTVLISCKSNIFCQFLSRDPCSRINNNLLLETNNIYNIHFLLSLLLQLITSTVVLNPSLEVDHVFVFHRNGAKCQCGATRQREILCQAWKIRYRNVGYLLRNSMLVSIHIVV